MVAIVTTNHHENRTMIQQTTRYSLGFAAMAVSAGLLVGCGQAQASTAEGARLQQTTCNGSKAQQFDVKLTDDGSYSIINLNCGKSLDVQNFSTAPGGAIQQSTVTWTAPVLPADPPPSGPVVDSSTLDNKLIFGYQGWFACE